jgi:hypothetical protein
MRSFSASTSLSFFRNARAFFSRSDGESFAGAFGSAFGALGLLFVGGDTAAAAAAKHLGN